MPGAVTSSDSSPPEDLAEALQSSWDRQAHVSGLAYELGFINSDLCGEDVTRGFGIEWITLNDLPKGNHRTAGTLLGVERSPFVAVVTPGSAAHRAGIRQGDTLQSINGQRLPVAAGEYYAYFVINDVKVPRHRRRVDRLLEEAADTGVPVDMEWKRDGEDFNALVRPVETCDFNIRVVDDPVLGIASHARNIVISSGLYDFAQSDAEIQSVIAHQLAHITERHAVKRDRNSVIAGAIGGAVLLPITLIAGLGAVADGADDDTVDDIVTAPVRIFAHVGGNMYAVTREQEADYVALYMLERSGIDAREAIAFWKRVPSESPLSALHVGTERRLKTMEATVQEIEDKRRAGDRLLPNPNRRPPMSEE